MFRSLACFVFAWTAHAAVLNSTRQGAVTLRGADDKVQRKEVCQFCQKLCPIACFVGTCGLEYGFTVRKFEATNKCFSCDPATSVGVSRHGDFFRCESDEGGGSHATSPFSQQQGIADGPQGPAVSGDAGHHAMEASQQAQIAVQAASKAAIMADKAAAAATAKYRASTGGSSSDDASVSSSTYTAADDAADHSMAAQIRAEESLRFAETAHIQWKAAMGKYNMEVAKLRKQQIIADQAEKVLEAAEASSEKARSQYAKLQATAMQAMENAMNKGSSAASKITAQAAAEELAGAAQAAHRRLVMAAKEAKEAGDKISIAASLAPCAPVLLQEARVPGAPAVIGCTSVGQQRKSVAPPKVTPVVLPKVPEASQLPSVATSSIQQRIQQKVDAEMDEGPEEPVDQEGQLEIPNVEEQLTANLAEKLESNPAAVQDASIFSAPAVPFSADQMPVDGTEHVPNFDMSTLDASGPGFSALQQGQRRMRGHRTN